MLDPGELLLGVDGGPVTADQHSHRFRRVSNRYPRMVADAYAGDLVAAMADTDAEVAARVADWERSQGLPVVDWVMVGQAERSTLIR